MRRFTVWNIQRATKRRDTTRGRVARLRVENLEPRQLLAANILVSELYYAPTGPTNDELAVIPDLNPNGRDFQFIEIYNADNESVNLNAYQFDRGVEYIFPDEEIDPGEYAVVVNDLSAFRLRFGDGPRVFGEFTSGSLNDDGERVRLRDNLEEELVDFEYSPTRPWPNSPDGNGASLELIDPQNTDPRDLDEYFVWRGSTEFAGSPASAGIGALGIVINEVLTHTDAPITLPDSIELFNRTDEDVDISGWYLSDSFNNPLAFEIPSGTTIEAGDYVIFTENDFDPTPENPAPNHFRLSGARGDEVILSKSDGTGGVEYFVDNVDFGGAANGESFGRLPNGTGQLGVLSHNSFGCANTSARVGPVVVSEIVYNIPISPAVEALQPTWGKSDVEFVEIHNPTNQDVVLTNWRIRGDVDYDFPADSILAAGETLLVTPATVSNPTVETAFRTQYGLPAGTRMLGPWSGSLGNGGGRVELQHPDEPPIETPDFYPRLIQDLTIYDDRTPWPEAADGDGETLQRVAPYLFGNDPRAWRSAPPSPAEVSFQAAAVNGDFNADGRVDSIDIDILRDFERSDIQVSYYDVNGDIVVNEDDVNHMIFTLADTQFGDANFDGLIDTRDYAEWSKLRDRPCGNWSSGDFNGDQFIDSSDFDLWELNKFTGSIPQGPARPPRAPLSTTTSFVTSAVVASSEDSRAADKSKADDSAPAMSENDIEPPAEDLLRRRTTNRFRRSPTARDSMVDAVFADNDELLDSLQSPL